MPGRPVGARGWGPRAIPSRPGWVARPGSDMRVAGPRGSPLGVTRLISLLSVTPVHRQRQEGGGGGEASHRGQGCGEPRGLLEPGDAGPVPAHPRAAGLLSDLAAPGPRGAATCVQGLLRLLAAGGHSPCLEAWEGSAVHLGGASAPGGPLRGVKVQICSSFTLVSGPGPGPWGPVHQLSQGSAQRDFPPPSYSRLWGPVADRRALSGG